MANNFFDDDEARDSLHQSTSYPSRGASSSTSRPPLHGDRQSHSLHAEEENNEHAMMRDRQEEYSLPPPLAQRITTTTSADKGKGRASTSAPNGNGARHQHRQHARESSTASMNIDTHDLDARPIAARRQAPQRQQGGGGFLDDNNDNDYNHTLNTTLAQDEGEDEDDEEELEGDGGRNESDIQKLLRLYMDERMAPELLNYPEELMEVLLRNLEAQTEAASVLLSSGATSKPDEHERLLLVQMEIERVRWLLRSYLRVRTFKIEKQAQYLLKTPLARRKMSDVERGYAERYLALTLKHFMNSVTSNIPERLGRLDEDEMVIRPELDQAVFARARKDCPPIILPDRQSLIMKKGEIHLVRYKSVRRLVRDGYVRLV